MPALHGRLPLAGGRLRLTGEEITRLAAFNGLSETNFIQKYTRRAHDHQGPALVDKPNGECIFLDGEDCAVQPVKLRQCRDFPNLWSFPGSEKFCRALPRLVSEEEYQ